VITLDEIVVPGKRLGRHIEHDPRSLAHPFGVVVEAASLRTVHHRRYGAPFNQGNLGSCTGNAAAGAMNTAPFHRTGHLLDEKDAVALYELATTFDDSPGQYPPDDTGSSGLAAAKALQTRSLISAYKHAFSVEEAVSALQLTPVITGVSWYEGFDTPDSHGHVSVSGQVRGGHEFELIGFQHASSLEDSVVIAENSWGANWGMAGRFNFTVATWRQLLAEQADVTILVK